LSCSPHASDTLIPAFDDMAGINCENKWLASIAAAVKLGAVSELALQEP
jgi:hypothetical protein